MLILFLVIINFSTILTSLPWPDCTSGRCRTSSSTQSRALQFLAIGDTGGHNIPPYYTSVQHSLAQNINQLEDVDFGLLLGDNFYFTGVSSENDTRFNTSFANVYNTSFPFYPTSGNHDWFGSVPAQIEYSELNAKWRYPSTNHTVIYEWPDYRRETNVSAQFVFVDTIVLCGNLQLIHNATFWKMLRSKTYKQPLGPENVTLAKNTWKWLERELSSSTAEYLFVIGHYPVHSIGANGPFDCLIDRLKPLLHKYHVNAYFAGHDHNLQHISHSVNDSRVEYIVSGAGSRTDTTRAHWHTVDEDDIKFVFPPVGGFTPNWARQLGLLGDAGYVHGNLTSEVGKFTYFNRRDQLAVLRFPLDNVWIVQQTTILHAAHLRVTADKKETRHRVVHLVDDVHQLPKRNTFVILDPKRFKTATSQTEQNENVKDEKKPDTQLRILTHYDSIKNGNQSSPRSSYTYVIGQSAQQFDDINCRVFAIYNVICRLHGQQPLNKLDANLLLQIRCYGFIMLYDISYLVQVGGSRQAALSHREWYKSDGMVRHKNLTIN